MPGRAVITLSRVKPGPTSILPWGHTRFGSMLIIFPVYEEMLLYDYYHKHLEHPNFQTNGGHSIKKELLVRSTTFASRLAEPASCVFLWGDDIVEPRYAFQAYESLYVSVALTHFGRALEKAMLEHLVDVFGF